MVVLVACLLVAMASWSSQEQELGRVHRMAAEFGGRWSERQQLLEQQFIENITFLVYTWLLGLQGVALTFWSLLACAQSVSGERDRKTWDFQRTTRLAPGELVIGKLLGEPILAYFVVLCTLPATVLAAALSKVGMANLLACYAFIVGAALFLGLCGLCISVLLESRSRGIGLIGALGLYGGMLLSYYLRRSGFPGIAALSPITGMLSQFGPDRDNFGRVYPAALFGHEVPWLLVTILLYATFGGWLILMLFRNIKRDYEQIRLLSRWQAIGCAAFLNFLIYALLKPSQFGGAAATSRTLSEFVAMMNGFILFVMGLATLTPHERLKIWFRARNTGGASFLNDEGLPWPWLAFSGIVAYALLVWGVLAWRNALPLERGTLALAAIQLLVVLLFVTRDVLFIQWCTLTRLRQPVVKGFLYLCLYYATAGILALLYSAFSDRLGMQVLSVLTPVGAFDQGTTFPHLNKGVYLGIALQLGAIAAIIFAINKRLGLPAKTGDAALAVGH